MESRMSDRIFFIICSFGRTATRWIGRSLNLHPDFRVIHGQRPIEADINAPSWEPDNKPDEELDPSKLRDRMFAFSDHKYCGLIHRHSSANLSQFMDLTALSSPLLNIIRHPISRLLSQHTSAKMRIKRGIELGIMKLPLEKSWISPFFLETCTRYKLDQSDFEIKLFFFVLRQLHTYRLDVECATNTLNIKTHHFVPMERLTADPSYFSWLMDQISNNSLKISPDYLAAVYSEENHFKPQTTINGNERPFTVEEQFLQLPEWQQYSISVMLKEFYPDIIDFYRNFGYSFRILVD